MKIKRLIEQLSELLSEKGAARRKRRNALKKVLKRLKTRKTELVAKIDRAGGDEKKKLQKKLRLIQAQRKKGLKALKDIKAET